MEKKKYIILQAKTAVELENMVIDAINDGYTVLGGVSVSTVDGVVNTFRKEPDILFAQALTRL